MKLPWLLLVGLLGFCLGHNIFADEETTPSANPATSAA